MKFHLSHLGCCSPGAHVVIGRWTPKGALIPHERVTVVNNYATTTGVVVVRLERTGAITEYDGYTYLHEMSWTP